MTDRTKRAILRAVCLMALTAPAAAQDPTTVVLRIPLIDNGDFRLAPAPPGPGEEPRLPWWIVEGGAPRTVEEDGSTWLVLAPGERALQPFAAYAPTAGDLVVRAHVRGAARLTIVDGSGGRVDFETVEERATFEIHGSELAARLGRAIVPRFTIELSVAGSAPATWTDVTALVPFPAVSPRELRAEIVSTLSWILDTWRARAADDVGRRTAFPCATFDAVTGKTLGSMPGGISPLYVYLAQAIRAHDEPAWRAALDAYLADYFELAFHTSTGLPRRWDTRNDAPLDEDFVQIGMDLDFLIDLASRGPEAWRDRARETAAKIGATVLARGVLPDGAVAAAYRPGDAAFSTDVPPLRRLDVPCQLARLGALLEDARYLRAARNAVAELEYTHLWPGTWTEIDPGFDDELGLYGARAVEMLRAYPDEPAFRALLDAGRRHYLPLWRDSTRFGGTVAADQVRCWALLQDAASLDPSILPEVAPRIAEAARAHLKGQQYSGGAWGDVTFFRWDTRLGNWAR
jgi:hypothetical protein